MLSSINRKSLGKRLSPFWNHLARQVPRQQETLATLADDEIRKESLSLQYRVQTGETLDSILVEAFALVREAAKRSVGMEHYPVQMIGGVAMHQGSIAVMQTGEGKTLTATLPMYVASLEAQGAHLATANDYLASRDAELVGPIFELLGRSVGVITSDTNRSQRAQAYACDLTYSTAKEFGFDFLRDRLLLRQNEWGGSGLARTSSDPHRDSSESPVQRDLHFMLVDEADSILIDEARTPLVVSALPDAAELARAALYRWAAENVEHFTCDEHFELDPQIARVQLTLAGRKLTRKLPHPESIAEMPLLDIYQFVEQALLVAHHYSRERHYVIRDGEVVIVDEFTGRLAEGRKWRAGLHQAIEARENLEVSLESGDAARITIQDLFLKYQRLAGMTGTVASSAAELKKIYSLKTTIIPTNRPPQREQLKDRVFGNENAKWDGIVDEVAHFHKEGRPVLIGTRSIDKSSLLSEKLKAAGIEHQVLNATQVEQEAEIVAAAGQRGKVTVATNMAGRGTDIQLDKEALDLGGLHLICTELHESARIDRQLVGRCGRQGDPGSYRQFMSLDDDILIAAYGERFAKRIQKQAGKSENELARLATLFRRAQAKIEKKHFQSRKMLLFYDRKRQEMQREMGQDPYLDSAG